MGELLERSKLAILVFGNGVEDAYRNNSLYFFNKYNNPDSEVREVKINNVFTGRFYFIENIPEEKFNKSGESKFKKDYWMRYSPVFVIGNKKIANKGIQLDNQEKFGDGILNAGPMINLIIAINFNLIPFDVRIALFDKFMTEDNLDGDKALEVDYQGVYQELRKFGFEYAIEFYPTFKVKRMFKIDMKLIPRFLYSSHPTVKYDPAKLYDIRNAKIKDSDRRDEEMKQLLMTDFLAAESEIKEKFDLLQDKIFNLQKRIRK